MSKKYCYLFTEGNAKMPRAAGRSRAPIWRIDDQHRPARPQGFTITTEACTQYYEDGRQINDAIMAEIMEYIEKMEQITGRSSAIMRIPCWSPSAPAPAPPCPA